MPQNELIKLSASMLGGVLECPACFWRDYHHPQEFHLPGILNRMDKIEKDYFDKYRNKLPPLLKGQIKEKLVSKELAEKFRKGMIYLDEKLNAQFKGKMDDCFIDSKGCLVVMDNKTASMTSKEFIKIYEIQLDSYAFLLQKNGFKVAKHGYLIYYTPEKGNPQQGIKFKAEVLKLKMHPARALNLFKKAVALLRLKKAPKAHGDCKDCAWVMGLNGL